MNIIEKIILNTIAIVMMAIVEFFSIAAIMVGLADEDLLVQATFTVMGLALAAILVPIYWIMED